MMHRCITIVMIGVMSAAVAAGGPIEDATYEELFDRAQGLMPGRTVVEKDLTGFGAWDVSGGQKDNAGPGIGMNADDRAVELVWKGTFPCDLPHLSLDLDFSVEVPVSARVMLYGFYGERFNRLGKWQEVDPGAGNRLTFRLRRKDFNGFKLVVEGEELAGEPLRLLQPQLSASFQEGYFRNDVELPDGDIWEAVAEVGNMTTLYVNGKRVDDETIIEPRPANTNIYAYQSFAHKMYSSRRVSLKAYLRPGKNVLGMYTVRGNHSTAAYLRGSAIMVSGERVLLDSGDHWAWSPEASPGWQDRGFDDSGWAGIVDAESRPTEASQAHAIYMSRFSFASRAPGDMPCYDGFIKLANPRDNKFYFNDRQPFDLEAAIPSGFSEDNPELAWEISRYAPDGTFTPVIQGRVAEFKADESSLTATISGAALERGVYVLTGRLTAHGRIVEEREPEPMMVTGKVRLPLSAGDTLTQGMNLSLEQVIDFTDRDDPHPWLETDARGPIPSGRWGEKYYHTVEKPLIVESNGLTYRTTRPVARAQFSYKVDFEHAHDWYLMVLEYPDDAERWIGVSCNANSRTPFPSRRQEPAQLWGGCKCGPTIWTGGKYPNSGKMLEMRWVYRADPGSHAFNVMSLMKDREAAAARLRIYHIDGPLPELDAGSMPLHEQRRFGMLTERTRPWENGIYNAFSSFERGAVSPYGAERGAGRTSDNAVLEGCEHLRLMEDAASHFAEYMRFAGQNLHTMGCYQYHDGNTAPQYLTGEPRIHHNPQDVLGRVLDANDLLFYASVEFCHNSRSRTGELLFRSTRAYPQQAYFATRNGPLTIPKSPRPRGLNFLHPIVEADMLEVARQLAEMFKHQPHFLGINWTAYFGGAWLPSYRGRSGESLEFGYDDFTVGLFEADTGIDVPGEPPDAERYENRYQFLSSDEMRPQWLAWRSRKMAEFFVKVNRVIQAIRPDLETVASCYVNFGHIAEWQHEGVPFKDYLGKWGWDPAAFQGKDDLWLMPWLHVNARYQPGYYKNSEYAMAWQGNHDEGFYRPFAGLERRALMLCACWIEVERIAANYPYREGWPRPYQQTMMGQPREEMAMDAYTQGLIGFDPDMVMMGFTDVSPYVGVEDVQRKFTRVLRRLPQRNFERVLDTGFESNLAIRALRDGEAYHFYVANPGYWPINGTVTVDGAARVEDLVSGQELPVNGGRVAVALQPFGVSAFTATGPEARVAAWRTDPLPDKHLKHMRSILEQARAAKARQGIADFLGDEDFAVLTDTVDKVEQALSEQRYAAAWRALTDAFFWTVLFEKAPEIDFADMVKPRTMTAVRLGGGFAPDLDGVLDDPLWQERYCKPVNHFVTRKKEYSKVKTVVRVAYSGHRLFLSFECHDPDPDKIRGTAPKDDERKIWGASDDLVDFFIMPDEETYYQFAVSASGATFDQRCSVRGGRDYDYAPDWKSAVKKHDWGWAVEVEVDTLDAFGVPVPTGGEWKANFHRMFRLKQHPISSWCFSPSWHDVEQMGTVKFVPFGR